MMKTMLICAAALGLAGCSNDAQVASYNLSQAADNFGINRRIIFYNGITNDYILTIEGLCSLGNASTGRNSVAITCKTGPADYKKHFIGLADNATFFAEQIEPAKVGTYQYRVTFKPTSILPSVELR